MFVQGNRFFGQHVHSSTDCRKGRWGQQVVRRGDHDAIHVALSQQGLNRIMGAGVRRETGNLAGGLCVRIGTRNQLQRRAADNCFGQYPALPATANDSNPQYGAIVHNSSLLIDETSSA